MFCQESALPNFKKMLIKPKLLLSCWKSSLVTLRGGHCPTSTRGLSDAGRGCLPNTDD